METKLAGQEIRSARLILEPKGGGGDTRYEGESVRVVEQYKTRSHSRTWSLKDLIEDVLPDLFVDADPNGHTGTSKYRFATDGRCGDSIHSPNFQRFLQYFKSKPAPEDLVGSLDNTKKYPFFNRDDLTDRALFLRIAHKVRPKGDRTKKAVHYYKVWQLLAGFEIDAQKSASYFAQAIDEFLIQVVERREEVEAKRRELCTFLREQAAGGNAVCTAVAVLSSANLNAIPLSQLETLKAKLREMAEEVFEVQYYDREKDIRGVPNWPTECSVLVLKGESSQGKTWRLFRLADNILDLGGLAVIVSANGKADDDLQRASNVIWLDGLDHDGPLEISRLAARYRAIHGPSDWLTICLDDVQEISEVNRLLAYPWKDRGIRLALTAPLAVGKALAIRQLRGVHVGKVSDFTSSETRDCLERRGRDWSEIPDDVRDTLRRPILAELYCRVAEARGWAPHNEYEIYERFWQRVTNERDQPDYPSDRGILLRLAGSVIKADARYPWPQDFARDTGLSDEALRRLESIGWLRREKRGDVEIWHDRLLNLAVAEWLIDQRRTNQLAQPGLAELLCRMYQNRPTFAGRRLGYVPMDYLWLACDPENGVQQEVSILLQALEEHPSYGGDPEAFYTALVPTMGRCTYPALRERLKASVSQTDEEHFISRLVGQAIAKIGKSAPESARGFALDLIVNREFIFRAAGMHILKDLPDPQALDVLWEIHRQHFGALLDPSDTTAHLRYDLGFSALRGCIQLAPHWLVEKIHNSDPKVNPVSELGWLLWSLEHPEAKSLWYQFKTTLFEKASPGEPRSLIRCIGRFKDREEIPRLRQWLGCDEDFAQPAAFSVLCQLDPNTALIVIEELAEANAAHTRSWWLPQLLLRIPQRAHERLLAIARQRGDGYDYLANIYADYENLIDAATLGFYLDALEAELAKCHDQVMANDVPGLGRLLGLVANIHRPDLLRMIAARANTPLEKLLLEIAQCRLPRHGLRKDDVFDMAHAVLCKIGGEGLTELINSELGHDNHWARRQGLKDALRRSDDRTRALLLLISQSHELEGNLPRPVEQRRALRVLAALGDDQAVIRGILRWGQQVPRSILSYRTLQKPVEIVGLREVLDLLIRKNIAKADSALIAASISRNRKYIPAIQEILKQAPPESHTAWCAATALMALGDKSEEFVELLIRLLATSENRFWAMQWLSRIGSSRALEVLMQHLETAGADAFTEDDWVFSLKLFQRQEARDRVRGLIVDRIRADNDPGIKIYGWHLEILPELDLENAYDLLLEEAFSSNPIPPERVVGAIKGLWKLDPSAALRAAELALKRLPQHIKDGLPGRLVEFAGEQAIGVLCRHARREASTATRWCIARALRLVSDSESVGRYIQVMLSSQERCVREVAVEICGWQPPGFMRDTLEGLAREDLYETVSRKAIETLQRQEEHQWVKELMDEFRTDSTSRRWNLLTSIIQLGDPFLLADWRDRLWIGRILDDTQKEFWELAQKEFEERKRIVLENARRIDQRR